MATESAGFHEPENRLTDHTKDMHRALVSLQEELEAVDWYQQRVEGSTDAELKAILAHNRDEEKEHAAMLLEWLRRADPSFASHMKQYLFQEGSIVVREHADTAEARPATGAVSEAASGLTVGSLMGVRK